MMLQGLDEQGMICNKRMTAIKARHVNEWQPGAEGHILTTG